ncbi:MAG: prepilin peptidase [Eggerthellaceae bacterium]|jgi:leader peptidase (prepilin peptidase)/N-methyltransferase
MGKAIATYGIAATGILLARHQMLLTGEYVLFAAVLVAVAAADIRYRIIPDALLILALAVRVAYLMLCLLPPAAAQVQAEDVAAEALQSVLGALCLPALLLAAAALAGRATGRTPVGGGDVKLFAVVGAYFGWRAGLALMFASCLFALPIAGMQRAADRRAGRLPDGTFPFAPAIALACWTGMLVL